MAKEEFEKEIFNNLSNLLGIQNLQATQYQP